MPPGSPGTPIYFCAPALPPSSQCATGVHLGTYDPGEPFQYNPPGLCVENRCPIGASLVQYEPDAPITESHPEPDAAYDDTELVRVGADFTCPPYDPTILVSVDACANSCGGPDQAVTPAIRINSRLLWVVPCDIQGPCNPTDPDCTGCNGVTLSGPGDDGHGLCVDHHSNYCELHGHAGGVQVYGSLFWMHPMGDFNNGNVCFNEP